MCSLQTADVFPVVASLPPKNNTVKPVLSAHPLEILTAYTGLTNVRVIQENEGSQRAKYLSHGKLIFTCFYLFFRQKKNVKDHFTPYTERAVALVWYVFSKWSFNRGENKKKIIRWDLRKGTLLSDRLIEGDRLIEVSLIQVWL